MLKTQFTADNRDDLLEQSNNAVSINPVNDHSPGSAIVNLMDNSYHQHESVYLEQQPQLPSIKTDLNMVESEGGMDSSPETKPDTVNTTYLLTAKINRIKLKTDLVRFFMENKVPR